MNSDVAAENLRSQATSPWNQNTTADCVLSLDSLAQSIVDESLLSPIRDLLDRPSKRFRAELVKSGALLADGASRSRDLKKPSELSRHCESLADALEAIHTGSLIIDDIEDDSKERRGAPALHEQYGLSIALNAGNWLYFQPFEWIQKLALPERVELRLYRLFHETMLSAHLGQAIDLGTRVDKIDQKDVPGLCESSLVLKTGALMALALGAGATLAGASEARTKLLLQFGKSFGIALQMFDDIGNCVLSKTQTKRLEDLRLKRPTWIWAYAAQSFSRKDYRRFIGAVEALPNEKALMDLLNETDLINEACKAARRYLNHALTDLALKLSPGDLSSEIQSSTSAVGLAHLRHLAERVSTSYGA